MLLKLIEIETQLVMFLENIIYLRSLFIDGTKESLIDNSHKPNSPHPNKHTDEKIKWIKDLIKKHKKDNITLGGLWYK